MGLNIGTTASEVLFQTLLTLVDKEAKKDEGFELSMPLNVLKWFSKVLTPLSKVAKNLM